MRPIKQPNAETLQQPVPVAGQPKPSENAVVRLDVSAYRIPTETPEADGTIYWDSTTLVLVEAVASSGECGLGYTYASAVTVPLICDLLAPVVTGTPVDDVRVAWGKMIQAVRNVGRPGIASTAISAVDTALWDLKAQSAKKPLFLLLGAHRREVPIYGSGGFTTYSDEQLRTQLAGWVAEGITQVKMKIARDWGSQPEDDLRRVKIAREAIGPDAALFVDANGGYTVKQAIELAQRFYAQDGVTWFEEPVSSDQLDQLHFVREHVPMQVAAGEYGFDPWYFRSMLGAGAVDVLQADATRCLGVTGFLEAGEIAHGFGIPFSAHTAPALHAQVGCVVPELFNVEYFFDHARIEHMLFAGGPQCVGGYLRPDPSRPGLGIEFKRQDAQRWKIVG
ncbi:MAG TPA: enolase C-terminal domain-like protein [Chloroflexota bacterium]|nr:enolase C-terminal domain-like protein [Chloroflexota bacterium]